MTLPYPISANRYWRPVRIGDRITIVPTKEAKQFKENVGWLAKAAGIRKPFPWRVSMLIELYPHRPLDWQKRQKEDPIGWEGSIQCLDLGNCEKVLSDAFNGVVFTDDKMIWRTVLERNPPDERGARVVVTITPHRITPRADADQGSLL